MLKGKMVLAQDYFGTVINDAENEEVLILQSIRQKIVVDHGLDPVRIMYGAALKESYWERDDSQRVIPWNDSGTPEICETIPEFLEEEHLGYHPMALFLTTEVNGRTYIDW